MFGAMKSKTVAALLVIGFSFVIRAPADARPLLLRDTPITAALFANCVDCVSCGMNGHTTFGGDAESSNDYGDGGIHYCVEDCGGCNLWHPFSEPGECTVVLSQGDGSEECGESAMSAADRREKLRMRSPQTAAILDEVEEIRAAIAKGDFALARKIAELGQPSVMYVSERNAIQVEGCNKKVVAHFPLGLTVYD